MGVWWTDLHASGAHSLTERFIVGLWNHSFEGVTAPPANLDSPVAIDANKHHNSCVFRFQGAS